MNIKTNPSQIIMLSHCDGHGKANLLAALGLVGGGVGFHMGGTELKGYGSQRILKDDDIRDTSKNRKNSANGFLGYGGALTLVNGSPFEWTLNSQTSYQMDTWKWPSVPSGNRNCSTMSTGVLNTNTV